MRLYLGFVVVFFSVVSYSSSINDHRSISYEGVTQFEKCVGRKLTVFAKENFVISNVNEDINLLRKWLGYSHFYNPHKDVSTWRGTSMNRMVDSEEYLLNWKQNLNENSNLIGVQLALSELGNLVHHIQDSAVPAHVVPVKHWLHDSFEKFSFEYKAIQINCAEIPTELSPREQLRQSALRTLEALREPLNARFRGTIRSLPWDYFWYDTGNKFGNYGYFGNRFGDSKIDTPSGSFEISQATYRDFWLARRTQSVHHTAQMLYWFFSNLITSKGHSNIHMSDGSEVSLEELLFEKY